MPIVVSRPTGQVLAAPAISQERRDAVWERLIKTYLEVHPECLQAHQDGTKESGIKKIVKERAV